MEHPCNLFTHDDGFTRVGNINEPKTKAMSYEIINIFRLHMNKIWENNKFSFKLILSMLQHDVTSDPSLTSLSHS